MVALGFILRSQGKNGDIREFFRDSSTFRRSRFSGCFSARRGCGLTVFRTSGDEANRAAVLGVPGEKLNLVGMAFYGERKAIDKVVKGLSRHE
jgi:hypothetical protein